MSEERAVVFVVDVDLRTSEMVSTLTSPTERRVVAFGCAGEYIACAKPDLPACLVLDLDLPDINGLELQERLADTGHPPIVFVTGHGDVSSSVRALKRGAIDFLTKPLNPDELAAAIEAAILEDRKMRARRIELGGLRQRFARLSPREREVLPLVIAGRLNKQAAAELGISETTLQIHRRNVMRKMEAGSLADLVRMGAALEVPLPRPRPRFRGWMPAGGSTGREVGRDRFSMARLDG